MVQDGARWCKIMQYHAIHCNTMQYHAIQCNTMQYHLVLCNTVQYQPIPCNSMQFHAIPCITMQYHALPCNTMQYHACLITADGAYHCPVGSIWPFFHQNYSNKPNIFELDSHHLNETNIDLFVPESRISTNLPLMQTSLGTIAYDKVSAMVPFLNQKPPNLKVVIEWQKKGLKRLKKGLKHIILRIPMTYKVIYCIEITQN